MTTTKQIRCASCDKAVKVDASNGLEPEYSKMTNDFFCTFECAVDFAINHLEIVPIYASDLPNGVVVKGGRVIRD